MISTFLREQKRYTQKELCRMFECSEEKIVPIIRKLKEFGILKAVKVSDLQRNMSDLIDEDIEIADVSIGEDEYLYVFTFVGVIVIAGRVLKCYPKYLLHKENPIEELKQILKVLDKYNSKHQIISMFNDDNESASFNLLAIFLFLIQDYFENGVYNNTKDVIESNGCGEIIWDKTINETFTLFSNNRPCYIDYLSRKRITNDFDYFKRLHECILTKASQEMREADFLDLFGITEIELTDEQLDEFGDKDYILYRIENELSTQFNTRKQLVLKTLYAYISHNGKMSDISSLSMFGTNNFNIIWEKVCAEIMDNQLNKPLGTILLPIPLKPEYNQSDKLIDLIEKPLWSATGKKATDTLIPDFVTIHYDHFIIFDAKYYNTKLESGSVPKGQPGIESITKQYLYQLAYQKFISDHGFSSVKNCFIMPTENSEVEERGEVSMEMLSAIGLQNIKVRFLPATIAFDHYLSGKRLDISVMKL